MWPAFFTPKTWTFENAEWYSSYRLNITAINGDTQGLMQISEFEINGELGDTVDVVTPDGILEDITDLDVFSFKGSNDAEPWPGDGSPAGERLEKLFDNDVSTKYLVGDDVTWIDVYTGRLSNVTGYTITSANDVPERDPKDWEFQGWEGDSVTGSWVTLHTVVDNPMWPDFFTPKTWSFTNSGSYSTYRLNITAINGDSQGLMQIAELEIYGLPGDTVDVVIPTSVEKINHVTPIDYTLSQNYPNPFNPTTQIDFSIKIAGRVTLNVYNMLGQVVATLVNEELTPGSYKADFDGVNLASGVYVYRLIASDFSAIKKMVLIK